VKPFVLPTAADAATEPFFAATREGFFPLHRCVVCQALSGPNELSCHVCTSPDFEVVPAAGTGTVVSFTVQHSKPAADGSTHRLTAGIIELTEGPWWWTQVVAPPEEITVGLAVRLEMVTPDGGEPVPVAYPA
jgi:uncharacterized OB-fold protein